MPTFIARNSNARPSICRRQNTVQVQPSQNALREVNTFHKRGSGPLMVVVVGSRQRIVQIRNLSLRMSTYGVCAKLESGFDVVRIPNYQGVLASTSFCDAVEISLAAATDSDVLRVARLRPADEARTRKWEDDTLS